MRRLFLALLLCGLLMMQSSATQKGQSADPRKDIDQAFGSGKFVVLVVAPAKSADEDSEAYGDWAEYLNAFSSSVPANTKIIKLTAARYKLTVEEPKIRREFATVFLKDATHALLYDGMILEAKVYKVGLGWLHQNATDKELAGQGLKEKPAQLK